MSRADKRLARLEQLDHGTLASMTDAELSELAAGISPADAAAIAAMTEQQLEQVAAGRWPGEPNDRGAAL